nr:hypothetical protein [Parabacteroides merdae]MCQ5195894.1 hypothetical protein [Parabacteroides merdae]
MSQHRNNQQAKTAASAAHNWAPAKTAELTPAKATADPGKISFEDVL